MRMSKVYNAAGALADRNAYHNRNRNPYPTRTLSLVVVGSVCLCGTADTAEKQLRRENAADGSCRSETGL